MAPVPLVARQPVGHAMTDPDVACPAPSLGTQHSLRWFRGWLSTGVAAFSRLLHVR
jgi:hypothetical protein